TGVLRHCAGRSIVEPVALRRRALRPSRRVVHRSRRHVSQDALRRLRRRSEAPDPGRHVRALARLLRRVLPEGATGPPIDRRGFSSRVRELRRHHGTDRADDGLCDRRERRRSGADVPERHLHGLREPDRCACDVDPVRLRSQWPARRAATAGTLLRRGEAHRRRASLPASDRLAQTGPHARRKYGLAAPRGVAVSWEVVIGLETHAQLSTASKIFSGASTAFGAPPNSQASAVDLALPGTLTVLNRGAVERAIRFGLAVGATINRKSVFARKNYFYPDLPKGYQISQYEVPVVQGGALTIDTPRGEKTVHLTRAHLEEDAGKSLHENLHGKTGIDLNRAGTPLLEIVSEPDMRSAAEAVAYAKTLHALVRWIGICDGNMQEGSFRCDANVSVRREGDPKLGTRCEIKNLNSFRFMQQAIEFEVRRQIELIDDGGTVVQETRLFDPDRAETRSMRSKEDAQDYRYFPDPDLPPLVIDDGWVER